MKATIKIQSIILTAIFIFLSGNIFAGVDGTSVTPKKGTSISLAPSTPAEATFEEITESPVSLFDLSALAPVTPKEATFYDVPQPAFELTSIALSPKTPAEADFNDDMMTRVNDIATPAPETLSEADY